MVKDTASLTRAFHALSDPARLGMVDRLSRGSASVTELARPLSMSMPSVMQHLRVLENSGLIRSEKVGRVRTCHIEPKALRQVEHWIRERQANWDARLDKLGEYLAEQTDTRD